MKAITNLQELEKILRNELITQTELSSEYVLNALSVRGTDLEKRLSDENLISIDISNSFVLFYLQSNENANHNFTEENIITGELYSFTSYTLYIIIYGNDSKTVAQKIKSRFESQCVRTTLHDKGIHLEHVSNMSTKNEFKNSTMWIRHDIDIDFSCKTIYKSITTENNIDIINKINIIKEE